MHEIDTYVKNIKSINVFKNHPSNKITKTNWQIANVCILLLIPHRQGEEELGKMSPICRPTAYLKNA